MKERKKERETQKRKSAQGGRTGEESPDGKKSIAGLDWTEMGKTGQEANTPTQQQWSQKDERSPG